MPKGLRRKFLLMAALIVLSVVFVLPSFHNNCLARSMSSDDLWDISKGCVVAATSGVVDYPDEYWDSNIYRMFGAVGGDTAEPVSTLFADYMPAGTIHWVEWRTSTEITLRSFNLVAAHDGDVRNITYRGFSTFRLFSSDDGISWNLIYTYETDPDNDGYYGGGTADTYTTPNALELSVDVRPPVIARHFRAEFVQTGEPGNSSGPRIVELDGYDTFLDESSIEPVKADMTPGADQAFAVLDKHGDRVDNSKITWRVIKQESISPFVATARIGTIDSQGVFTATGIGTCTVRATMEDNSYKEAAIKVSCASGSGDLSRVIQLYRQRIPSGPLSDDTGYMVLSPGSYNNIYSILFSRYAGFTCGEYQSKVLEFLHNIQASTEECSMLNDFEFGPVQTRSRGHHAVAVYPAGTDWKKTGTVFDPWYNQKPETFPIADWPFKSPIADTGNGDNAYPTANIAGVVHCPVNLLFTDPDGRRSGIDDVGEFHFEIPGVTFIRMSDDTDGYQWYFSLEGDLNSYKMTINAIDDGTFEVFTVSASDMSGYQYTQQPIKKGQSAHMEFSVAEPDPPIVLPDSTEIDPQEVALPELCWFVDSDLNILIPRFSYNGSYFSMRLKYSHDLFWTPDMNTLIEAGPGEGMEIGDDLSMEFPCMEYAGVKFSCTMVYDHDLYWCLDLASIKLK